MLKETSKDPRDILTNWILSRHEIYIFYTESGAWVKNLHTKEEIYLGVFNNDF